LLTTKLNSRLVIRAPKRAAAEWIVGGANPDKDRIDSALIDRPDSW
jgi:hypothetical protein